MAQCYHRKRAWLNFKGLSFGKKKPSADARRVTVPCGQCIACRVNNAASWAIRCMHEASYCDESVFVTFTYNRKSCPKDYSLRKKDFQDMMKRLRIQADRDGKGHIRSFFAVGEYGGEKGRPHYHAIIMGLHLDDLRFHSFSHSGAPIYTSRWLERIWGKGFCPIGTLSVGSAAYVARYEKKGKSDKATRSPSFFLSSRNIELTKLRPDGRPYLGGLGAQWVIDHHFDLRHGFVIHPDKVGVKCRIPDYYFDLLQKWWPVEYEEVKALRYDFAVDQNQGIQGVDIEGDIMPFMPINSREDGHQLSVDEQKEIAFDFLSYDKDIRPDFTLSELARLVAEKLKTMNTEQTDRLLRLKRNLHKSKK